MELKMNEPLFRTIVGLLLVLFVLHRAFYTRKIQHANEEVVDKPDLGALSKIASLIAVPAFLATLIYLFFPQWLIWSEIDLSSWIRWLGVIAAAVGFGLLQWSQSALGKNWSDDPVLIQDHRLVTNGPYRWVRHPLYSAFLLIFASLTLISASWLIGLLWLAMTALDILARVSTEESLMLQQFGGEYQSYMQKTGRFLPRIG
jgi:protein-S-isoprenylcysteine O-methyltransferase Ste14